MFLGVHYVYAGLSVKQMYKARNPEETPWRLTCFGKLEIQHVNQKRFAYSQTSPITQLYTIIQTIHILSCFEFPKHVFPKTKTNSCPQVISKVFHFHQLHHLLPTEHRPRGREERQLRGRQRQPPPQPAETLRRPELQALAAEGEEKAKHLLWRLGDPKENPL